VHHRIGGLQWVHGSRTVVICRFAFASENLLVASMGPRFENRGYLNRAVRLAYQALLQWVHGSRTVVIILDRANWLASRKASMGPRFENRGYPGVPSI